jgi:hypothetical protein
MQAAAITPTAVPQEVPLSLLVESATNPASASRKTT